MNKKREINSYIFWGIASMLLNIGMSQLLVFIGLNYKIANILTLITVKIFCYITNKLFVFKTPFSSIGSFLKELLCFICARWFTFMVDYFGVILLVDIWHQKFLYSKCILSIIVIVLNYVFSKWLVFRKEKVL